MIFHAGTAISTTTTTTTTTTGKSSLVTSGGRVLAVTSVASAEQGSTLADALQQCYRTLLDQVQFEGMQYRKDIGHRALKRATDRAAMSGGGLSYADAGVSIDQGNLLVEKIKALAGEWNCSQGDVVARLVEQQAEQVE